MLSDFQNYSTDGSGNKFVMRCWNIQWHEVSCGLCDSWARSVWEWTFHISESSMERKFSELSAFAPREWKFCLWTFCSWDRKCAGTKSPDTNCIIPLPSVGGRGYNADVRMFQFVKCILKAKIWKLALTHNWP